MEQQVEKRHAPPWIFAITNIPYGAASGYAFVAAPFMLSNAGVDEGTILRIGALVMLPAAYQLFWAPVIDLGFRRRVWLVLVSIIGALCLGASMMLDLPRQLVPFQVLMVLGQLFVGLVASCNGALISTSLPDSERGKAAGWVNAGNLGAATLGGGLIMTLLQHVSVYAAAFGLVLCIVLPALAALTIPEAPPMREKLGPHLNRMRRDVWAAVRARKGWTGLLFCLSPVGTVVLVNVFTGMGKSYNVSPTVIEWLTGWGGGLLQAAGALASGFILDRIDRRKAYLASGVLTALCGFAMAAAPLNQTSFIVGTIVYQLITGFAYAAFSAVVFEIVGTAGSTASTLYSVFPAAGNQAIAYVMFLNSLAQDRWGARGLWLSDATLNIVGVVVLMCLLRLVFPAKEDDVAPEAAAPELAAVAGG